YLEGSDQHRGWFQSSLLTSVAMTDKAPYRACLTHGFTVDEKGYKMSKSSGNGVEPTKLAGDVGADIIRLWVAATDYRGELSFSREILNRTADSYRRVRNTARFLLGNLFDFDAAEHTVALDDMTELDRWAIARAARVQQQIISAYDEYSFHHVYQAVHQFCAVDMGSFYLDILKDRLYTAKKDSVARRSAQTAMYHIMEAMVRWIAPVLSFTADEIWNAMPARPADYVFTQYWHDLPAVADAEQLLANWREISAVRDALSAELEKLRKDGAIGSSLQAEVTVYADGDIHNQLARLGDELRFAFITSTAEVQPWSDKPEEAIEPDANALADVPGKIAFVLKPSEHGKCVRCWHYREEVGQNAEHPELCERCITNVAGEGETRSYA
ncbi:MAG: isoleucine--tRNA ligase, partial [Gammaproteobacteria bacterium]